MDALLANTLALALDAAPWLLLGLLAAGLIKGLLPEGLVGRWLGGKGLWPVAKAAVVGAPLPLCSCGVMPAALALHRDGASRGATVSFLIATPETGVDSIAISYALLGPFLAVVRPIAAVLSALFAGLLAALVPVPAVKPSPFALRIEPACSGGSCCSSGCAEPPPAGGAGQKALKGVRYALTDILDDIALWLVAGVVLAGVVATVVPPQALSEWGGGLAAMLVMLLVGVPMYICATASTPLAAALLLAGVSPGTVLVFLLAGPATNLATLAVVRKELGSRVLLAYLGGIAVASVGLGLAVDALVHHYDIDIAAQLNGQQELVPAPLAWASLAVLTVFAIRPLRRRILR